MQTVGKKFETALKNCLYTLQRESGIFIHRFKDSTSAGRILGNSPADFLVAANGHAQIWEAKSSEVRTTLRSCLSSMVDHDQVGHHNLWHANGLKSYFFFYSDLTGLVEIWDGETIVESRKNRRVLNHQDMVCACDINRLTDELRNLLGYMRHTQ